MKIKLIDFGGLAPSRAYSNDVGADVYSSKTVILHPGETRKIPLGIGVEIPIGYAGFIFPRSGLSARGVGCELPPIDPGYTGEIHAILHNIGAESYQVTRNERVGQLVIIPVAIADFVEDTGPVRGSAGFGSTGSAGRVVIGNSYCRHCSTNPANGGSGICNCTLGTPTIT